MSNTYINIMLAVNNVYKHFSQLPGGRCYQKGGVRLENALFNCFPNEYKKYIHRNLRPKNTSGDVIVEYDMLYVKNNELITFEVKGLNDRTSKCPDRQNKIFNQAIRQKNFLTELYKDKDIKHNVVFCFVTGQKNHNISCDFILNLKKNGILVSIGVTPNDAVKSAIHQLKSMGYSINDTKRQTINHVITSEKNESCENVKPRKMLYSEILQNNN
jgi:hypothetical protein